MTNLCKEWQYILSEELQKSYMLDLFSFIENREKKGIIVKPETEKMFSAFEVTPYRSLKVVIVGQDPYYTDNYANGLAFSATHTPLPPSLRNIYKEIEKEFEIKMNYNNGDLTPWANQGVLLLNSVLTVEKNSPGSHSNKGWEQFTDVIVDFLNKKEDPLVFMLWGNYAKSKGIKINSSKHWVLKTSHPSPLSVRYGFFGCDHFIQANEFLISVGEKPIDWKIS